MKKRLLGVVLILFLLVLTACRLEDVEHPLRETPTEAEQIELVKELKNSTVQLLGYSMEFESSQGSGMIFKREESPSGKYYYYVVTNHHVVRGLSYVLVVTQAGNVELGDIYVTAGVASPVSSEDIALVRFESEFDYPLIPIIPYDDPTYVVQLSVGQTIFGIGSPTSKDNFNLMTNYGVISDLSSKWISHTLNINPGNSGGPLFSYDGTFIGINTQRIEVVNNNVMYLLSESIDVNQVARMIKQRFAEITPKFGITVDEMESFLEIDPEDKHEFDPEDYVNEFIDGIVVTGVAATRPSYGILQMYDVIIEVNGTQVTSIADFSTATQPIAIGNVYEIVVSRKDPILPIYVNVTLEVEITHV